MIILTIDTLLEYVKVNKAETIIDLQNQIENDNNLDTEWSYIVKSILKTERNIALLSLYFEANRLNNH